MQLNSGLLALALAGFAALTAAQPHKHLHARHHLKPRELVTQIVTLTVDQNGNFYPQATPPPSSKDKKVDVKNGQTTVSTTTSTSKVTEFVTSTMASEASPAPVVPGDLQPAGDTYKSLGGIDSDFPDGQLPCSHFPSDYGAVPLKWVTSEGWSGIQINGGNGDKGVCTEGALCSYACPPGYSKAQWPEVQPTSGESHGGLECRGGKLHLTRGDYKRLCRAGKGSASVVNKLKKFVAICRTDYPGSENMVVPLSCSPGTTQTLTVPDALNSYVWRGNPSSAQYYVNNAGIELENGCVWGPINGGRGNWSPVVIGAGYSGGKTWLSISQNSLNSDPLNYNIRIVADGDSKISQDCRYENGKLSNGDPVGCTVAVEDGGSARFELY